MENYQSEKSTETLTNQTNTNSGLKNNVFLNKTKLESFIDVLASVANTQIKELNQNSNPYSNINLKNAYALEFLTELNLIKQNNKELESPIAYCITQKGQSVLKYFRYFDKLDKNQKTRALKR
ncbi:MAG: hypothetical protein GX638_16735 [Crenarchaeota archaeon]|nr:hypothetical protein [Thermoproteota archaeon]